MPFPVAGSQTASTTAGTTIIQHVRAKLVEATASFFEDTGFLVWINEGIHDIVAKTWCLAATEDVTLVDATLEYTLSTAYIVATAAIYDGAKALLPGSPTQVGHVPNVAEPVYWYEWNNKVGIYPIANATTATKTVTIYKVARPTALATTAANSPLPFFYDYPLELFVEARALFEDGRKDDGVARMQEYYASIQQYRKDFSEKPRNSKESLKQQ